MASLLIILFCCLLLISSFFGYRYLRLRSDTILNPHQDPFLKFAETERILGRSMFYPWRTSDPMLLKLSTTYFPEIVLPDINSLRKPNTQPVAIILDKEATKQDGPTYFLAVGGPPAAAVAYQAAKQGKAVLYVNDQQAGARPIWAGAANHGEPDVVSSEPAFISGQHSFAFIWHELRTFLKPPRYCKEVLAFNYPWLTFNAREWLKQPRAWPALCRVALGSHRLAARFEKEMKAGKTPQAIQSLKTRTHASADFLEKFEREEAHIIRVERGGVIFAPNEKSWRALVADQQALTKDERSLHIISAEFCEEKYGFKPRHTIGIMEKPRDFIIIPTFMQTLLHAIKQQHSEVHENWRLTHLFVDPKTQQGKAQFLEVQANGENKVHLKKFNVAHLSLGATQFEPEAYSLLSVTGVSINALIIGLALKGGPFVCGALGNHVAVVPLAAPQVVTLRDKYTGDKTLTPISFVRIATGGSISPLEREAKNWYRYPGKSAVNALHCVRQVLPLHTELKILSVIGCNRVVGADGRQVEIHPYLQQQGQKIYLPFITFQIGSGGGGLTQIGASTVHLM